MEQGHFWQFKGEKKELLNEIDELQKQIMSNNFVDLMMEKSLRDELNHVLLCEEIMWAQRAKTN